MNPEAKILFIGALLISLVAAAGCSGPSLAPGAGDEASRPLRVVCTIGMITDAAERIGGEQAAVKGLMGPGIDPHSYKASESDVTALAGADLILYGGLHLEARMAEVFERMSGRVKTVAVSEAVPADRLLTPLEFEGHYDPHVWFDVALWKFAVQRVADALSEADPDNATLYAERVGAYLAELDELDAYVRSRAQRLPENQRVLITAHDAFNYFGRAYGFEVRGLQGISTAAEAGTADVQALARFITDRKIRAVFVESSVPRRNLEAVQEAVRAQGFEVSIGGELFSDAMGAGGTPEGTYVGMVRHNVDTIVGALAGE